MQQKSFFSARDYRSILEQEYELRRARRPNYTLSAYARDLGISATRLCAVLKKRYGISPDMARALAGRLQFNEEQTSYFTDLVELQHSRSKVARSQASARIKRVQTVANFRLGDDPQILGRWYYAATLELLAAHNGNLSKKEISKRLGISLVEATAAIRVLIKLGEIVKTESGFEVTKDFVVLKGATPQKVIRDYHVQVLDQIKEAIEREPIPRRKNLSTIFSFKASQTERAREWLAKAQQEFLDEFGISEDADNVYALGIHLVPLDRSESKKT